MRKALSSLLLFLAVSTASAGPVDAGAGTVPPSSPPDAALAQARADSEIEERDERRQNEIVHQDQEPEDSHHQQQPEEKNAPQRQEARFRRRESPHSRPQEPGQQSTEGAAQESAAEQAPKKPSEPKSDVKTNPPASTAEALESPAQSGKAVQGNPGILPNGERSYLSPGSPNLETEQKLLKMAEEAFLREDVTQVHTLLKQATSLPVKSSIAMYRLGELFYYHGLDTPLAESAVVAERYLNESADLGNPDAQHLKAVLVSTGITSARDVGLSVMFDYFSAMGGSEGAKMALGFRHLYGYGTPKSCNTAALYYSQVAESVVKKLTEFPITPPITRVRLSDVSQNYASFEDADDILQYYQQSADSGDAAAQLAVGTMLYLGAGGVTQHPERAAHFFAAAADQGDASALGYLGQMYLLGEGVQQNNETAREYFEAAAKRGNSMGHNGLGLVYMKSYGVEENYAEALKHFKKAAEQGHAEAQFHLGSMYLAGFGVEKSLSSALQYFSLASQQGHTRALFNLAQMQISGLGTVKSCDIGVKLLKTVAERGEWARDLNVAYKRYLKGEVEASLRLYTRLAEEGFEIAQANSAFILDILLDKVGQNHPATLNAASRFLKYAAEQGNVDSLRVLGDYAYAGKTKTGQPEFKKAAQLYQKAGTLRNAQSLFNLGMMHEFGEIASAPDFYLAKRFYDQAYEVDAGASVPVRLALAKLWLKSWFQTSGSGGSSGKKPANSKQAETPNNKKTKPKAGLGKSENNQQSAGTSGVFQNLVRLKQRTVGSLSWEDILLLSLCGLFAVLVYLRAGGVQ